jgi:hypothetical protein
MKVASRVVTAALGVGILAVAGAGVAAASNGSPALLGNHNSASGTTTIKAAHGSALSLVSKKSVPSLKVSSSKLVHKLDAQFLDGKTATQVGPKSKQFVGEFPAGSDGGYITCPSKMAPVGGGVLPDLSAPDDDGAYVVASFPHLTSKGVPNGWLGETGDADHTYNGQGLVYVDCTGSSSSKLSAARMRTAGRGMVSRTFAHLRHDRAAAAH